MKKPSKAKRKTGSNRSGRAGNARPARTTRAKGAAAHKPGKPNAVPARAVEAVTALRVSAQQPARRVEGAYSTDERVSFALLLVPVLFMSFAVGAIQAVAPKDSARRQLAVLPAPVAAPARTARLDTASEPPLAKIPMALPPPQAVHAASLDETIAVAAPETIEPASPDMSIVAQLVPVERVGRCVAPPRPGPAQAAGYSSVAPVSSAAFGLQLAAVARAQTEDLVVYTDRYRDIGFPMGDVPSFYGVCTDVVIRAYRALGIDLQVLVHKAHIGTGDPSIDHRRTQTLRRFFQRHATSLPVTDFVEEYQPGDIVTYHRPDGRGSQAHIAVVADVLAPSGRPMIVHNRGWGPQLEDALFANQMTGHYRFSSGPPAQEALLGATVPTPTRGGAGRAPAAATAAR